MKNVKKSIVLIFAVVVISASMFSSCKKSDDSARATLMNHKWELSSVETDNETVRALFDLTFLLAKQTYKFNNDGNFTITIKPIFGSAQTEDGGTWSISDDGKELTMNDVASEIIELTSKVLKTGPNADILGDSSVDGFDYVLVYNAK